MDFSNSIPGLSNGLVFDIYYQDWSSGIKVCASGSEQTSYTLNAGKHGRQFTITNETNQEIGSSKIHVMTSRIDVVCKSGKEANNNTFQIRNDGIVFGSPQYTSPTFDGQTVTWKNKAMATKIIYTFIDGQAAALAHFESDPKTKVGRLEILVPATEVDKINELMVTLLTLLHRKLQAIYASYVAAVTS